MDLYVKVLKCFIYFSGDFKQLKSRKMANNGTYSLDRPVVLGEQTEYSTDPAFGGFLSSDYKKYININHY